MEFRCQCRRWHRSADGRTNFNPWIRLYGPMAPCRGVGQQQRWIVDPDLIVTATNTGTFTVVAGSLTVNPNGNYTLTLARTSGQIFVTPGHAGGFLTNGLETYRRSGCGRTRCVEF